MLELQSKNLSYNEQDQNQDGMWNIIVFGPYFILLKALHQKLNFFCTLNIFMLMFCVLYVRFCKF